MAVVNGIWSDEVLKADGSPALLEAHLRALVDGSGLSLDVIRERGYWSAMSRHDLHGLGYSTSQQRLTPALVLPVHPPDDSGSLTTIRPDHPRTDSQGRPRKYELPAGSSVRLDVPPCCRQLATSHPSVPLWITEGPKKGDALAKHGFCAGALLGVWGFLGKDTTGSVKLLSDFDLLALKGRTVNIVFDSDVMTKPPVRKALDRLIEHLQRKGAIVNAVYLPGPEKGVDDFLLTHGPDELEALVTQPRPSLSAAAPTIELLDEPPAELRRLLQVVDDHAYLVTWLHVKRTATEIVVKGEVVRLSSPQVTVGREIYVLRDDGAIFGEGCDKSLAELGFQVCIPMAPRDHKLFRKAGVSRYLSGQRPKPGDVFGRMVKLVDRFMSFDQSLAPQDTMCKLVACYALASWFLDAFDVIGFMWPSGDYGTGKSKLGYLTCEVSYLGEVLLSGSTYATLRDLADLGALLVFDDCEALADPKRADPDKRNLLLAGNRRGSAISVKEPTPNGGWQTRWVNTYCPRVFTAIQLPDPVLASRTFMVPLVRTAEASKGNSEVLDYRQWPCDRNELIDDLWSLALANLTVMRGYQDAVNLDAPLIGRNLEPWRALLSVAMWLEAEGETGLYQLMRDLATSYQTQRVDLEQANLTVLIVRAMLEIVCPGYPDVRLSPRYPASPDTPDAQRPPQIVLETVQVTRRVNDIAKEEGLWIEFTEDDEEDDPAIVAASQGTKPRKKKPKQFTNEVGVGRKLRLLKLRAAPKVKGEARKWQVTEPELDTIARRYGQPSLYQAPPAVPPDDNVSGGPLHTSGVSGGVGDVGEPDAATPDSSASEAPLSTSGGSGASGDMGATGSVETHNGSHCSTPGCPCSVYKDGKCYPCYIGEPLEVAQ